METLYTIILDVNPEIIPMIYDIIRIITLQIVTHSLFCMNNPAVSFLNPVFIQTIIFLSLSLVVYWLVIKKLFSFKIKETKEV